MRIIRTFVLALIAAFGASYLAGCATSESGRATGQVLDDASITARVKTAIAKEAGVGKALDVNVTTYRGTVQLSGFVESGELASRAAQVARNVEGVQAVKNDIVVTAGRSGSSAGSSSGSGSSGGSGSSR